MKYRIVSDKEGHKGTVLSATEHRDRGKARMRALELVYDWRRLRHPCHIERLDERGVWVRD